MLGMLFGMIVILGALAGAIWYAVAVLTPDQVTNNQASDYVGDYGKMSLKSIYDDVMKKFESYRGKYYDYDRDKDGNIKYDADGKPQLVEVSVENGGQYMTLGMFCATSGINLSKLLGGVELPQSVLDVPVMEYFNGSDGVQRALSQIKVSILPDIMNMFTTTDESGQPVVNQAAIEKLAGYSITDLMSENGIEKVFSEVKLADLVSQYFPQAEESGKELLYALGQTTVGGILQAMRNGNVFAEIKEGGALEKLGNIKVTQLVASDDETINNAFGNSTLASLVDDNGKLSTDSLMSQVKVGSIMGYKYDSDADRWYTVDGEGNKTYAEGSMATLAQLSIKEVVNVNNLKGMYLGDLLGYKRITQDTSAYSPYGGTPDVMYKGDSYAKKDGDVWYIAKLNCSEEHTHTSDCFAYAWYTRCTDESHTSLGEHAAGGDVYTDGNYYTAATGVFGVISNVTLGEIMDGASDKVMETLQNVKLADLGITLPDSGLSAIIKDMTIAELAKGEFLDDLYVGEMLGYKRVEVSANSYTLNKHTFTDGDGNALLYVAQNSAGEYAASVDDKTWYKATFDCEETHTHTADCYNFVWYQACDNATDCTAHDEHATIDGANYGKIQQLYQTLANVKIGDITSGKANFNDTLNNLTLADVLGEGSIPSQLSSLKDVKIGELGDRINEMTLGEFLEYTRGEEVTKSDAATTVIDGVVYRNPDGTLIKLEDGKYYVAKLGCTDGTHAHNASCYTVWSNKEGVAVIDFTAKIASTKLSELNNINDKLMSFTLADVMGNDIPAMLKSLQNTQLKDIGTAIKTLRIGEMLEYSREDLTANANNYTAVGTLDTVKANGDNYIKADGSYWYKAKLVCDDEKHDALTKHTADCFDYVWTKDGAEPDGVVGQLASMTVDELSDSTALNNRIQEMKLGDVMTIDDNDKPLGALKNVKIKNLSSSFNALTLGDVIAIDNSSAYALRNLASTPIGEIGNKFKTLTLADVVEIDNNSPQLLQTLKDENIDELGGRLNTITLGEVIEIDENSNPMLRALADKQVNNLATELDNMKMGVMLGYTAATTDSHSTDAHWDDEDGNLVKGIYAKIADKTVKDMSGNGMKDVVGGLTMGDLLDSGMMDLGEGDAGKNNEYKLAIIYCQGAHSNSVASTKCTVENYFAYKTKYSSDTMAAKSFYLLTHNITSEEGMTTEQIAHRDVWKQETLNDFITMLFSVL